GATLCRYFRMGLSELEARFLSGETGASEISVLLHHATQYGRGEFHLSAIVERHHRPEMDRRNARQVSLRHKGPPSDHAYLAAKENRRIHSEIFKYAGAVGSCRQIRTTAFSVGAKHEGRYRRAERIFVNAAARCDFDLSIQACVRA